MVKSSKTITLALIGTAAVGLIGTAVWVANSQEPTEEEKKQQAAGGQATTHRRRSFFFIPGLGGGLGGTGVHSGGSVAPAPAPSSRGGFGSTGSASAST